MTEPRTPRYNADAVDAQIKRERARGTRISAAERTVIHRLLKGRG